MNMRSQAVDVDSTPEPALDSPAGWRVVSAVFVLTAVTYGSAYSFSAMFPGLADDFRASRSAVALVFSLAAAGFHTSAPSQASWPTTYRRDCCACWGSWR